MQRSLHVHACATASASPGDSPPPHPAVPPPPTPPARAAPQLPFKCSAPGVAGGLSCKPVGAAANAAGAAAVAQLNAKNAVPDGPATLVSVDQYATQVRRFAAVTLCKPPATRLT